VKQEQAFVPIIVPDSGAGFVVGGEIGQFAIPSKRLAVGARADAPGNIEFFADAVFPEGVDRADVTSAMPL
jgi:hypothetical protein